jgi:type II pantothenate kinase
VDNYNEIIKLAEIGDNRNLDLLIKEVYGGKISASNIGLENDVIASSFGKMHQLIRDK